MTIKQEKITREKFNNLKKYYDETWDETSHTLHVGMFKKGNDSLDKAYEQATKYLIENASRILPITKESVLLDIGCGTGRTLIQICLEYGCSGVGVDLSDEQIKDAKKYLKEINDERALNHLLPIRAKFIRGSGSDLKEVFKKDELFTHVVSQDAILLVSNKLSLFENINRLLVPGGIFAVADFLSESKKQISKSEESLVYKLVNWNESLSYESYIEILEKVGLNIVRSERKDEDMIKTYDLLAKKMKKYSNRDDKMYSELEERYKAIVSSVKNKKMGWGFFFSQKKQRKTALICGTKEKSIGRFVANYLHSIGWNIFLYSRNAKKIDKLFWHERKCDITSEKSIKNLLAEIDRLDLVMMLADSGDTHNVLEELSEYSVKSSIDSKLVGSLLLSKALVNKFPTVKEPIKIVWCGGNLSKKPKNIIIYSIINSGLASYIQEINSNYQNILKAYYLTTPLISPSTLGDEYIKMVGTKYQKITQHPQVILDQVLKIIENKLQSGVINTGIKAL